MTLCVIVQGPTEPNNVKEIKRSWSNFPIIFSTWEDADKSCYEETDTVIYNKFPENGGIRNLNLQRISSLNGFKLAKELGYTRCLKWRQDFFTNNSTGLVELFKNNCINMWAFVDHHGGYCADFFMEGDIESLISIFDEENIEVHYPEEFFTNQIYKLRLDSKANFIVKQLTTTTDIYWQKYAYWFTQNIKYPEYGDSMPQLPIPTKNVSYYVRVTK